jgi:hypothetical protein
LRQSQCHPSRSTGDIEYGLPFFPGSICQFQIIVNFPGLIVHIIVIDEGIRT